MLSVLVFTIAPIWAVLATAAAAATAFERAQQAAHGEEHRRRHNNTHYYLLYHISKEPIWNTTVLTIHARPMV